MPTSQSDHESWWWVSAKGRIPPSGPYEEARVPWGVQHARRPGNFRAACGLPSLGWLIFWDLRFPAVRTLSCRECLYVVSVGEATVAQGPRSDAIVPG